MKDEALRIAAIGVTGEKPFMTQGSGRIEGGRVDAGVGDE